MVQVEKTFDNPGDDYICEPLFFFLKKKKFTNGNGEKKKKG